VKVVASITREAGAMEVAGATAAAGKAPPHAGKAGTAWATGWKPRWS